MNQNVKHEPDLDELFRGIPDDANILDISTLLLNTSPQQNAVPGASPSGEEQKKRKRTPIILLSLLLSVILIFFLHAFGVFKFPWEKEVEEPSGPVIIGDLFPGTGDAQNGMLPNMTKEEVREQLQIAADANYFSFKVNTMLILEDGKSPAPVGIENPSYNVYPMVIQIHLGEDGEGDLIYDSGGILPNHYIDYAQLTKELPEGTYKALAQLHAYDPATHINVFKSTAALTIIIQN